MFKDLVGRATRLIFLDKSEALIIEKEKTKRKIGEVFEDIDLS